MMNKTFFALILFSAYSKISVAKIRKIGVNSPYRPANYSL